MESELRSKFRSRRTEPFEDSLPSDEDIDRYLEETYYRRRKKDQRPDDGEGYLAEENEEQALDDEEREL